MDSWVRLFWQKCSSNAGSHIVEALIERGETNITAFDIRPSPLFANDSRVKFIQGDLRKKEDLLKACQGLF